MRVGERVKKRYFVSVTGFFSLTGSIAMADNRKTIIDFSRPPYWPWTSVNDVVMGGVSDSLVQISDEGTGVFAGHLSLENNGGFASARVGLPENDYSGYAGIMLRVKGDGKRYSFRLRTDRMFDGMVYRQEFDTAAGEWMDVEMPFSDFRPSFRGRTVPDAPPLNTANICQLGFLISDKQEGEFRLEIERIEGYGA